MRCVIQNKIGEADCEYERAIDDFHLAVVSNPHMAIAHVEFGNALKAQQKTDKDKCRILGTITRFFGLLLGPSHEESNPIADANARTVAAIDEYRDAIARDARHALARYYLGITLFEGRDLDKAIDEFRMVIEYDNHYADAHLQLARAPRQASGQRGNR